MGKVLVDPTVPAGQYKFTLSLSYTTTEGSIDESLTFEVKISDQKQIIYKTPEEADEENVTPPIFEISEITAVGQVKIDFSQ